MQISRALLLSVVTATSTPTLATGPGHAYLDLMPYLARLDSKRAADPGAWGLRASYGWDYASPWYHEIQVFGTMAESDNSNEDIYQYGVGFDFAYQFGDRHAYTPYLLTGAGVLHNEVALKGADDTNAFINFAAGVSSAPVSHGGLRLRAEVRYLHDLFESGMNDWQLGFGVSLPLHRPPPAAAPVPTTPAPAAPEPVDSDGDGVLDRDDRCPDTLARARVDSKGCVIADQTITLTDVHFETASAALKPEAREALQEVARALRSQPDSNVEIAGHTDSRGNDAFNQRLSRQRAESVRDFLVGNGVAAQRLSAAGYGESRPVATNDTPAGRAMNRRVEMRFR